MARKQSVIAPEWWDYTTLDDEVLRDAAALTPEKMVGLTRIGFRVILYDTLEDFYLAEALEYVHAWRESTPDRPVAICGPIGPTAQLPLVARLVNELNLDFRSAHYFGTTEWVVGGKDVGGEHPLSFEKAVRTQLFERIRKRLRVADAHMHFPKADSANFRASWNGVRCAVLQATQGEAKGWAFNDPAQRTGKWKTSPPSASETKKLATRVVDLHPLTIAQCARTATGGNAAAIPTQAVTVGPVETWKADKVSIWHDGTRDTPFGQRLTTLMLAKKVVDTAVPITLLADHLNVQFNFVRSGLGSAAVEIR